MRKRLWIFAAVLLLLTVFPAGQASAYEGTAVDGVNWRLEYGKLTISGMGGTGDWLYSEFSRIGKLDLYPTGFLDSRAPWSAYRDDIRIVEFEGNITEIGSGAFLGCSRLKKVTIPDTVTKIGDGAFLCCTALEELTIPDSVSEIGSQTFQGCSALKVLTLPAALDFHKTPEGASITKPFDGCTSLTEFRLTGSGSVRRMSTNTERNENAPWRVVSEAGNLFTVILSPGITGIGANVFYKCAGLTDILIPEGVTVIESCAFQYCSGLTAVTLPGSVEEIGYAAFGACPALTDIYYTGSEKKWSLRRVIASHAESGAEPTEGELLIREANPALDTAEVHFISPDEADVPQPAAPEAPSFPAVLAYSPGQFADVAPGIWYEEYVRACYERAVMKGKSETLFDPQGTVTAAEAVTMASRIHASASGKSVQFPDTEPWYEAYVSYAVRNGITQAQDDYTRPASRAQFALILSGALDDAALPEISLIGERSIPDVAEGSSYYDAVYRLYRAGVLTGSDEKGSFYPDSNISRAEAAAIVSRILVPALRKPIVLDAAPFTPVPMDQLANLKELREGLTDAQLEEAYRIALDIVLPYAGRSREDQMKGIVERLSVITAGNEYSMTAEHYNDPYGYFVLRVSSCAGWTKATGLCLNILGIPYEHVNAHAYDHQWCRVDMGDCYWVCDSGYSLSSYAGPETDAYRSMMDGDA